MQKWVTNYSAEEQRIKEPEKQSPHVCQVLIKSESTSGSKTENKTEKPVSPSMSNSKQVG